MRTIPLKRPASRRARRPREDPKVPEPQAVLPKSARPESKQILKPARMVPSRSCKSYIFPLKGPIQTPQRAQVRLLRVADLDNSEMGPPIPPEEPRAPPGTPSLDQVPGEG